MTMVVDIRRYVENMDHEFGDEHPKLEQQGIAIDKKRMHSINNFPEKSFELKEALQHAQSKTVDYFSRGECGRLYLVEFTDLNKQIEEEHKKIQKLAQLFQEPSKSSQEKKDQEEQLDAVKLIRKELIGKCIGAMAILVEAGNISLCQNSFDWLHRDNDKIFVLVVPTLTSNQNSRVIENFYVNIKHDLKNGLSKAYKFSEFHVQPLDSFLKRFHLKVQ